MENQIQSNISPVQQLTQTPTQVPPSANWLKVLLFSVLGFAIVVGSVFVGIQIGKGQKPNQQPVVAQPTVSPTQIVVDSTGLLITPRPIITSTLDWKTYTSNLINFSIKYPQNWLLTDLTEGKQIEIYYQPDKTKSVGEIIIEIIEGSSYNRELSSNQAIVDLLIGNTYAKCKTDNVTKTWCYLTSDSKYLSILIVKDKNQEYNKILDQILSTFKFSN